MVVAVGMLQVRGRRMRVRVMWSVAVVYLRPLRMRSEREREECQRLCRFLVVGVSKVTYLGRELRIEKEGESECVCGGERESMCV